MLTALLILIPLLAAALVFNIRSSRKAGILSLFFALAEFGVAVSALLLFRTGGDVQFSFRVGWPGFPEVFFRMGMDGLGILLVALTAFVTPLALVSAIMNNYRHAPRFFGLILLTEMALVGVFTAQDGLLFYVFWELALVPVYFICGMWGSDGRIRSTLKFFIYTLTGSLLMLVALIYLYLQTPYPHSFDFTALYAVNLGNPAQTWIFLAFFLAFAIKIPIFPFHTWQPATYADAPVAGTVLLAGIMLKMGVYGIIRLMLPLCHEALQQWGTLAMILALAGVIYASVIAIKQNDVKRLIAYSSIAHAGLITAGVFSLNAYGLQGAVFQMLSHGVNVTGLFLIADILFNRLKTRDMDQMGGLAGMAPRFAVVFMVILLASVALPLTNGFVGEFLLLLGIYRFGAWFAFAGALTIVFSVVYMLRAYQRIVYTDSNSPGVGFIDLKAGEMAALVPLILLIFGAGVFPGFLLRISEPVVNQIMMISNLIPN